MYRRIIEIAALAAAPAVLVLSVIFHFEKTALLSMVTVLLSMVPFLAGVERQRLRPQEIMPVVVLAAVAAAGRVLFAPFPNVKPVTAVVILSGICLGRQKGFLTGALAALASNLFFGQGPWTPWQMYGWGVAGYLAGVLEQAGWLKKNWQVLCFGVLACLLYGWILDSWYITGFVDQLSWKTALAAYAAGLPSTLTHAAATVVFLRLTAVPWRRKISRIQRKYGL